MKFGCLNISMSSCFYTPSREIIFYSLSVPHLHQQSYLHPMLPGRVPSIPSPGLMTLDPVSTHTPTPNWPMIMSQWCSWHPQNSQGPLGKTWNRPLCCIKPYSDCLQPVVGNLNFLLDPQGSAGFAPVHLPLEHLSAHHLPSYSMLTTSSVLWTHQAFSEFRQSLLNFCAVRLGCS